MRIRKDRMNHYLTLQTTDCPNCGGPMAFELDAQNCTVGTCYSCGLRIWEGTPFDHAQGRHRVALVGVNRPPHFDTSG
jgi:hypothetical protein